MEPLLAQLQTLPQKLLALPLKTKAMLFAAIVVGLGIVGAARIATSAGRYEYVFTQLSQNDSTACATALTSAGMPFRVEANGAAIAVPEARVHEARLLLAGQGLPRQGGVGFELFDKSDLGVSEFTQRVNLQRATEGELARTVQSLGPVREARVHITLPKKGLFRDDDKEAQAAVMLKLHPGRILDDAAVAGIRNLVAAAVPGLSPSAVSIVDDSGALLGDSSANTGLAAQKKIERSLEERVIAVLEPTVGRDAVVARVTANIDDAEEDATRSDYDPERVAVKSERTRNDDKNDRDGIQDALVGAAANAAASEPGYAPPNERSSQQTRAEQTRTYEVSGTVTRRTVRTPRVTRISVAVVVDEKTPRTPEEVARLRDLAKRAVGLDEERGDQLELTSLAFVRDPVEEKKVDTAPALPFWVPIAAGGAVGVLGLVAVVLVLRSKKKAQAEAEAALAVAKREAAEAATTAAVSTSTETTTSTATVEAPPSLPPALTARDRAVTLALADPRRAAQVLEAWLDEAHAAELEAAAVADKALNPSNPPALTENANG